MERGGQERTNYFYESLSETTKNWLLITIIFKLVSIWFWLYFAISNQSRKKMVNLVKVKGVIKFYQISFTNLLLSKQFNYIYNIRLKRGTLYLKIFNIIKTYILNQRVRIYFCSDLKNLFWYI